MRHFPASPSTNQRGFSSSPLRSSVRPFSAKTARPSVSRPRRSGTSDSGEVEERGSEIDEARLSLDDAASGERGGVAEDERDSFRRIVQVVRVREEEALLAQTLPVVGREDRDRRAREAARLERVEEPADLPVREGDLAVVERHGPLDGRV
jgi:hypothetical protein